MKPIIGITVNAKHEPDDLRTGGSLSLNWNFPEMVARAGGVPILIPPMADPAELARVLDGWLIPGGDDIDARHFGEENHPKANLIEAERFDGERALFEQAKPEMPILGICYGCQFINVMRGGSLDQHLPDTVGHEEHVGGTMQHYGIDVNSRLSGLLGTEAVEGKSYHHQGIRRLGAGLKVVGQHSDGTVEAIEDEGDRWLFGVQWHPERTPNDPVTQRLFEEFVRACQKYAERKAGALR